MNIQETIKSSPLVQPKCCILGEQKLRKIRIQLSECFASYDMT